jgi:hypothetical protein
MSEKKMGRNKKMAAIGSKKQKEGIIITNNNKSK